VGTIDSELLLLTCGDPGRERWLPLHGSPRPPAFDGVPTVALPVAAGRAEIDTALGAHDPRRVVVHGTDADLAAVLLRLLRTDRLGVEVGYVPARRSAAAVVWGLGRDPMRALNGPASPVPLVRDDTGGVLVGRAEIRDLDGECYCDDDLVLRGRTPRLVVAAGPDGIGVRAGRGSRLPAGPARPVDRTARTGRGSSRGRAVQVGGLPFTVVSDGVSHPRPLERRTWYRHTSDWLLAHP